MPTVKKIHRPWMGPTPKKNARWANEAQGGVPNQFYRNAPWRHLRQRWLDQHPLCVSCKQQNRLVEATVVDHITPIRLGGAPLDETNLMSLCKRCHARKSGKERHQTNP
ncbi:HNH endonuclease [Spirosoma aureum]|uniref:Putative HNH nuclease YajD n=1 Tax=Spirosoma aureum TaxID=2692134 RepID=A0A6G9AIE2_9BACT|nr:HNH endonuclease signature motif containing protein [Spirosoma aureum]QIP12242.1 HNH endonuclease [Spirosoma aureum]